MSLMYEVNALNAAMIQAAEVCRQDMPEGDKVNAVLACFAGMKPVEAELVVHARWVLVGVDKPGRGGVYQCMACKRCRPHKSDYCPGCGAKMDAKEGVTCE